MTPEEKPIFIPQPELEVPVVIYRLHRVIENPANLVFTYKDIMREITLANLAIEKALNTHDEKSVIEIKDLLNNLNTMAEQRKPSM